MAEKAKRDELVSQLTSPGWRLIPTGIDPAVEGTLEDMARAAHARKRSGKHPGAVQRAEDSLELEAFDLEQLWWHMGLPIKTAIPEDGVTRPGTRPRAPLASPQALQTSNETRIKAACKVWGSLGGTAMSPTSTELQEQVARGRALLVCTLFVSLGWCLPASARTKVTEFDPPESNFTNPTSISAGAIAGSYNSDVGGAHAFIRNPDGTFTTFDGPGARNTVAYGINDSGSTTGLYEDNSDFIHGFVRATDGTVTSFDPVGSVGTACFGINHKGTVTGDYEDAGGTIHAFLRAPKGTISTFDAAAGAVSTEAFGINQAGAVTGAYGDATLVPHGFVRSKGGAIETFDPAGSAGTVGESISGDGAVAGYYADSNGVTHSFVRAPDGAIMEFDPPASAGSVALGIDKQGRIIGSYDDNTGVIHGYVRNGDGSFVSFDPRGSDATSAVGIDAGAIAGYYVDSNGVQHGFLRSR